jgi:hypothetical protein
VLGDNIFETTLVVWIVTDLAEGESWAGLIVPALLAAATVPVMLVGLGVRFGPLGDRDGRQRHQVEPATQPGYKCRADPRKSAESRLKDSGIWPSSSQAGYTLLRRPDFLSPFPSAQKLVADR